MKLLYRILFFLLTVFYVSISEAKTVLYCEVIALEFITSDVFNQQNENIEVSNVLLENDFEISCKNESDLVAYRNLVLASRATAAKGGKSVLVWWKCCKNCGS